MDSFNVPPRVLSKPRRVSGLFTIGGRKSVHNCTRAGKRFNRARCGGKFPGPFRSAAGTGSLRRGAGRQPEASFRPSRLCDQLERKDSTLELKSAAARTSLSPQIDKAIGTMWLLAYPWKEPLKRKGLACGLAVYCRKRACLVPCRATVTRSRGGAVQQNRFMQTPLELSGLKADCIEIVRN